MSFPNIVGISPSDLYLCPTPNLHPNIQKKIWFYMTRTYSFNHRIVIRINMNHGGWERYRKIRVRKMVQRRPAKRHICNIDRLLSFPACGVLKSIC